ncbi:MAG: A/G-specific adenine glycosylase [Clostridia bacterium]|nr:A/G-specific adenine glycosylase [Clostridia bacterium]
MLPGILLPWYARAARQLPWREDKEPYHVWLSEIMLQQTRVEAVKGYYARFLSALPDIASLAEAPEEQILKLWEGLGYYSRARQLGRAAREIMQRHGGVFPSDYEAIRALPGIGDYTAGAIGSICFNLPTPAIDGNVLRVISRICADSSCIDLPATKTEMRTALQKVYPTDACGAFTQALMELGATVCIPRGEPRCAECPAAEICRARMAGNPEAYPVRAGKKPRRIERRTVYLLRADGRIALNRRPPTGLLANLWELPNALVEEDASAALAHAEEWGLMPTALLDCRSCVHVFTHVEWHMTVYEIACAAALPPFVWATPDEMRQIYALPSAFRICLPDQL